jgi:hypothetical protein
VIVWRLKLLAKLLGKIIFRSAATFLSAVVALHPSVGIAADAGDVLKNKIRQIFGSDFKQYEWFSHPTNNFGLGTMFVLEKASDKPGDGNQWCASLTCLGLNSPVAAASPEQRLKLSGFADIGNGAPLRLEDEQERRIVIGGVVSRMFQIIGLSISAEDVGAVKTNIEFGPSAKRMLNRQKVLDYLSGLPVTSPVRQALNENRLAIVVADVVIESMTTTIRTTGKHTAGLDAYLNNLPSRIAGNKGDLRFRVARAGTAEYKLSVSQPLVVARLVVKKAFAARSPDQPGFPQPKAELSGWNDWVVAGTGQQ